MKSAGAVKHKLTQVRFRHLKKRLEADLRQVPGNCLYNAPMPGEVAAICLYGAENPATWTPSFCDEREDGGARARACELFCPSRSKEQVKDDFGRELNGMSLPEVAARYPDMAALIWVLDEGDLTVDHGDVPAAESPAVVEVPPEPPPVSVPVSTPVPAPEPPPASPLDDPPDDRPWWKKLLAGAIP